MHLEHSACRVIGLSTQGGWYIVNNEIAFPDGYKWKKVTPLTRIARGTFAHIVVRAHWLKANPILAVVMLTRGSLRIHHGNERGNLTELAYEVACTFARVVVDTVHADSSVLEKVGIVFNMSFHNQ